MVPGVAKGIPRRYRDRYPDAERATGDPGSGGDDWARWLRVHWVDVRAAAGFERSHPAAASPRLGCERTVSGARTHLAPLRWIVRVSAPVNATGFEQGPVMQNFVGVG